MAEGGIYPWKRIPKDGYVYQDPSQVLKPLPPPPEGLMWIKTRVVVDAEGKATELGDQEDPTTTQELDAAAVVGVAPEEDEEEEGTMKENEEAQPPRPVRQQPRYMTRWELVEKVGHRGGGKDGDEAANGQGGEEAEDVLEEEEEDMITEQAFLTHVVLPTDTCAGLRLRYKVTAADLRKYNNFAGEQIHMLQTLRIPLKPEAVTHVAKFRQRCTKDVVKQQFINATGISCDQEQEIHYYLSDANWKLSEAVAAYEEDRAWEEAHHARVQCVRLAAPAFVTAAASAPPLPAAAAMGSEMPPPSYASFFRKPRTAVAGSSRSRASSSSSSSQKKGWSFSSSFSLKKKRTTVYDMDNVVASASLSVVEDEYVILSSGDEGTGHEGQALLPPPPAGAAGSGMVVAMVGDEDHPQTPLLGRG